MLELFAAHPHQVLSRERIRRHLWGTDTHVDFDPAINVLVRTLRRSLGDRARRPRYIETIPRQGYRFVARVERLGEPTTGRGRRRRGRRLAAAIGLTISGLAWHAGPEEPSPAQRLQVPVSGPQSSLNSVGLLSAAAARDPGSATTHGALALALLDLQWGSHPLTALVHRAERAARHAIDLDPDNSAAHLALGAIAWRIRFDREAAERHLRAALRGDDPRAAHQYGLFLLAEGRSEEAVRWLSAAEAAGLRAATLPSDLAYAHWLAGDLSPARQRAFEGARRAPSGMYQNVLLVDLLAALEPADAVAQASAYRLRQTVPAVRDLDQWFREQRSRLERLSDLGYRFGSELALLEARTGDLDVAVARLLTACEERSGWSLPYVRWDPRFAALRRHPAFAAVEACLESPLVDRPFRLPAAAAATWRPISSVRPAPASP